MNYSFANNFHRNVIFCNHPISAKYRFKDVFQILPPNKSWPKPSFLLADHPFILEFKLNDELLDLYKNKKPKNSFDERPESILDLSKQSDFQKELTSLLNLFTTNRFYSYAGQKWLMPSRGHKLTFGGIGYSLSRKRLGKRYFYEYFSSRKNIPTVPLASPETYHNKIRAIGDDFEFPAHIDDLFEKYYFKLNANSKNAFRKTTILFNTALDLIGISRSIAFSAFVTCIETLMEVEKPIKNERCKGCGQPMYKVRKRFLDFLLKYGNQTAEFKKHADAIYKLRSKIMHTGDLFMSEMISHDIDSQAFFSTANVERTVRICLINWLLASASK